MPKPFSITIDVEESDVGTVFRLLNRTPGVVKLHLDLEPDRPTGLRKNGEMRRPYTQRRTSLRPSLRGEVLALVKGKPLDRADIYAALNPSNESARKTSVRNALYNSERDGFLKKVGKKQVALTEKGTAALKAASEEA